MDEQLHPNNPKATIPHLPHPLLLPPRRDCGHQVSAACSGRGAAGDVQRFYSQDQEKHPFHLPGTVMALSHQELLYGQGKALCQPLAKEGLVMFSDCGDCIHLTKGPDK